MAKSEREILEQIAADILFLSMEYIGTPYEDMIEEARTLTDEELLQFITA